MSNSLHRWVLPGFNADSARSFITATVDNVALQQSLLATLACAPDSCLIVPPVETLERLSPSSRVALLRVLGGVGQNPQMNEPFRRRVSEGPFSAIPGMPAAARPWLDRVEFVVDGLRTLVDLSVVCAHLPDAADQEAVFMALQGARTIDARVPTSLDPARFALSFAPSARAAALRRFRDAQRQGLESVPLEAFMPEFMRDHAGGYPTEPEADFNCFWSALRFSVAAPAWPLTTSDAIRAALPRTHRQVRDGSLYFGDVILFANRRGVAIHAANYLLGGLVLTKNGPRIMRPWQVLRLDDLNVDYPDITEATVWRPLEDAP